ncbi:hypothetical protein BCR32DRAFT_301903 [Anaeromyces robustus]|uniref:Uncharacterized protein n=1 Tax=Anaeromyces robustus TaxID=1754192 RepID=A0A1Y1WXC9_9FUNG|nr:hypothetical protein BCR32DRAFT_301903 [Anaeromyces robustus]|eukprot:ORX78217.1 hypothetical protein BCR32DRAFT_301903 [Anaeromyces robustus]
MRNYNSKIISLLLILSISLYKIPLVVYCVTYRPTNYTMQDVENIKVYDNWPCPENSSDEIWKGINLEDGSFIKACEYQYYCHKTGYCIKIETIGELYKINNHHVYNGDVGYYIYNSSNITKTEKLIPISCNKKRVKKDRCFTEKCFQNSDCFSNKCIKGVCMTDDNNPTYVCKTVSENSQLKVKCLLSHQEKCKNDNECGDDAICKYDNVCLVIGYIEDTVTGKLIMIEFIAFFLLIISLVILYFKYKITTKIKKKKENRETSNN